LCDIFENFWYIWDSANCKNSLVLIVLDVF